MGPCMCRIAGRYDSVIRTRRDRWRSTTKHETRQWDATRFRSLSLFLSVSVYPHSHPFIYVPLWPVELAIAKSTFTDTDTDRRSYQPVKSIVFITSQSVIIFKKISQHVQLNKIDLETGVTDFFPRAYLCMTKKWTWRRRRRRRNCHKKEKVIGFICYTCDW